MTGRVNSLLLLLLGEARGVRSSWTSRQFAQQLRVCALFSPRDNFIILAHKPVTAGYKPFAPRGPGSQRAGGSGPEVTLPGGKRGSWGQPLTARPSRPTFSFVCGRKKPFVFARKTAATVLLSDHVYAHPHEHECIGSSTVEASMERKHVVVGGW